KKVYVGGDIAVANSMVARGEAAASDFRFSLHLCGWAPNQLENEIKRGVWYAAATSGNVRRG
ncbi:unnamed protein product, partial [Discosporangium mesarthrocarpum]